MTDDNVTPFTAIQGDKEEEQAPVPTLYDIEYMTNGDNTGLIQIEGYVGLGADVITVYDSEMRPRFMTTTNRLISLFGVPVDELPSAEESTDAD